MAEAAVQPTAPCEVLRIWPRAAPAAFQAGLARLATPTAIVACNGAGGPSGLLATSLAVVSATPPRLLFSVDKSAAAHDALIAAESVSIALLGADQRQDAEAFDPDGPARFDAARWRLDPAAPPELGEALASFAGPIRCRIDAGSATIFIVDVCAVKSRDAEPLVRIADALRALA
jgi:flavin reductase (DIM6/NTAB) family NADH-FMN oxidoreductase RutF